MMSEEFLQHPKIIGSNKIRDIDFGKTFLLRCIEVGNLPNNTV